MNDRRTQMIQLLLRLKKESDRRNYTEKHRIATELIRKNPGDFQVDSYERDVVGVTHAPSGFRFHLPREVAGPLFHKTAAGGLDFEDYLASVGNDLERHKARSYDEADLIEQPEEDKVEIRPSTIEGRGTFVTEDVAKGDVIALATDLELHRTPAARFINHSPNPNVAFRVDPDGVYMTAKTDLKADTELTLDYGDMLGDGKQEMAEANALQYLKEQTQKTASDEEWIGVDLDGTLAKYDGWKGPDVIGAPIPKMVDRVKRAIGRGWKIKIFTARVAGDNDGVARRAIKKWCRDNLGVELQITCIKDQHCRELWDDIAKKVHKNKGTIQKAACGDMIDYFNKHPKKLKERLERKKREKTAALVLAIKEAALEIKGTPVQPKSKEQAEAGNYPKGHTRLHGMDITIENLKGQYRKGTSPDGTEWKTLMKHHYGYIKRTKSGADGDHVDVFIGPEVDSEMVFVVNQTKKGGVGFDEHKCMLGFTNEKDAKEGYLANYEKGWDGLGSITALTMDQFKKWISSGDTSKPLKPLQKVAGVEKRAGIARTLFQGLKEKAQGKYKKRERDYASTVRPEKYEGLDYPESFKKDLQDRIDNIKKVVNGMGSQSTWFYELNPDSIHGMDITPVTDIHDYEYAYPGKKFSTVDEAMAYREAADQRFYNNLLRLIKMNSTRQSLESGLDYDRQQIAKDYLKLLRFGAPSTFKKLHPIQKAAGDLNSENGESEYAYSLLEVPMNMSRRAALAHTFYKIAESMENVKELGTLSARELNRALRDAVISEHDMIKQLETVADSTENRRASAALQDLADREKENVKEIESLLEEVDPQSEAVPSEEDVPSEEIDKEASGPSWVVRRTLELIGKA